MDVCPHTSAISASGLTTYGVVELESCTLTVTQRLPVKTAGAPASSALLWAVKAGRAGCHLLAPRWLLPRGCLRGDAQEASAGDMPGNRLGPW